MEMKVWRGSIPGMILQSPSESSVDCSAVRFHAESYISRDLFPTVPWLCLWLVFSEVRTGPPLSTFRALGKARKHHTTFFESTAQMFCACLCFVAKQHPRGTTVDFDLC